MAQADLEELYALVAVGDTVELVGSAMRRQRSCSDGEPVSAAAQQPPLSRRLRLLRRR